MATLNQSDMEYSDDVKDPLFGSPLYSKEVDPVRDHDYRTDEETGVDKVLSHKSPLINLHSRFSSL